MFQIIRYLKYRPKEFELCSVCIEGQCPVDCVVFSDLKVEILSIVSSSKSSRA